MWLILEHNQPKDWLMMNNRKEMKINPWLRTCQLGIGPFCKLRINLCRSHRDIELVPEKGVCTRISPSEVGGRRPFNSALLSTRYLTHPTTLCWAPRYNPAYRVLLIQLFRVRSSLSQVKQAKRDEDLLYHPTFWTPSFETTGRWAWSHRRFLFFDSRNLDHSQSQKFP